MNRRTWPKSQIGEQKQKSQNNNNNTSSSKPNKQKKLKSNNNSVVVRPKQAPQSGKFKIASIYITK